MLDCTGFLFKKKIQSQFYFGHWSFLGQKWQAHDPSYCCGSFVKDGVRE